MQKDETPRAAKIIPRWLKSPLFIAALLVVSMAVEGVGVYEWQHQKNQNTFTPKQQSQAPSAQPISKNSQAVAPAAASTPITAGSTQPVKTFNFVDTAPWVSLSSKDGTYSIKIGPNYSHGYCNGDQKTVLVGMVYGSSSGEYDCNSINSALGTGEPPLILTRIAFGLAEDVPQDVKPQEVSLLNGLQAKRYEYQTTYMNDVFNNIVYIVDYSGTGYAAHYRWKTDYNTDTSGSISVDTFDTMVQKTWQFK